MCFKECITIQSVKQTYVTSVLEHKVVIWSSVWSNMSPPSSAAEADSVKEAWLIRISPTSLPLAEQCTLCWVSTALAMLWKENRAKLVVMGAEGVGIIIIIIIVIIIIIIITIIIIIIIIKVGKTSILRRFLFDQFQHQHSPTVEEMFSRDFDINNGGLRLELGKKTC